MRPETLENFKQKNGYEHNGEWLVRVTAITELWPKPGLMKWLANQRSSESAEKTKQESADWGTRIHKAVESRLLDPSSSLHPWEPDVAPVIKEVENWLADTDFKATEAEVRT